MNTIIPLLRQDADKANQFGLTRRMETATEPVYNDEIELTFRIIYSIFGLDQ